MSGSMDTSAPGDANPGSSQVAQGGTYDKNGGTENDNDKGEHGGSKEEDEDRPDQAKPEAHSALQSHCEGPGNARTDGARPNAKPRQLLQGRTMKDVAHARASDIKEQMSTRKEKLKSKAKPPGGLDDTPLPDAPPGYTVKFTFLKCTNLPPSDLHTTAADPYLVATLTTNLPRRHREDPPLEHRTRTIYRQTEPEWNEEWIVANVPGSGFTLKCRLYDEDWPDRNDRLGNVTVHVPSLDENWGGWPPPKGKEFPVKKRVGSKTAYLVKGIASALSTSIHMTPHMYIAAEVLGRSDPPHGQMFTLGPSRWVQHFSPVFGRLTGTKVNKDSSKDAECSQNHEEKKTQKHDFQANELQLRGPVPSSIYHRYVEFRPLVGMMFSSHGLRGRILNKALHKQHKRVYNFNSSTKYGSFEACSTEASMQLLKMAHFGEGGRIFTYVLTLDGLLRFTETGPEFGIDLLSKHTMHSDVATYVAYAGEFFIHRLENPVPSSAEPDENPEPHQRTHPDKSVLGGPSDESPPHDPRFYQLVIDNDSGTYRPEKSLLPDLKEFLERQFSGLDIVALHCQDEKLEKLKEAQRRIKRKEGQRMYFVMNRSPSSSGISSDDESALGEMEYLGLDDDSDEEQEGEGQQQNQPGPGAVEKSNGKGKGTETSKKELDKEKVRRSKHERAWDVLAEPRTLKAEVKQEIGSAAVAVTGERI